MGQSLRVLPWGGSCRLGYGLEKFLRVARVMPVVFPEHPLCMCKSSPLAHEWLPSPMQMHLQADAFADRLHLQITGGNYC